MSPDTGSALGLRRKILTLIKIRVLGKIMNFAIKRTQRFQGALLCHGAAPSIGLKAWRGLEQQLWAVEQGKGLGIHGRLGD